MYWHIRRTEFSLPPLLCLSSSSRMRFRHNALCNISILHCQHLDP
jgi:hypothetical protein